MLGSIQHFDGKWLIYLLYSLGPCDTPYYLWYLTGASVFSRSIWCYISRSTGVPSSSSRSLYSAYSFMQKLGSTNSDPGVHLGIYLSSLLVSGLFSPWESWEITLNYSGLSIYSSPTIICGYNYANGLAYVLSSRILIALLLFSLAQFAIDTCLVLRNGCLHVWQVTYAMEHPAVNVHFTPFW